MTYIRLTGIDKQISFLPNWPEFIYQMEKSASTLIALLDKTIKELKYQILAPEVFNQKMLKSNEFEAQFEAMRDYRAVLLDITDGTQQIIKLCNYH